MSNNIEEFMKQETDKYMVEMGYYPVQDYWGAIDGWVFCYKNNKNDIKRIMIGALDILQHVGKEVVSQERIQDLVKQKCESIFK